MNVVRYKIQQRNGEYCLKAQPDGDLVDYSAYKALMEKRGQRAELLERIAALATEYCIALDCAVEDIGGTRLPFTILQELGPLTSELEKLS